VAYPDKQYKGKKSRFTSKNMSRVMMMEIPVSTGMTSLVKGDDEEQGTDEPAPNPARSLCANSGYSLSDQLAIPQALTRGPTRFLHPRQLRVRRLAPV